MRDFDGYLERKRARWKRKQKNSINPITKEETMQDNTYNILVEIKTTKNGHTRVEAVAVGTVLESLDPRHSYQFKVAEIANLVSGTYLAYRHKGRRYTISVDRLRRTWGHRNGYRVAVS